MRFGRVALTLSAALLGACGGARTIDRQVLKDVSVEHKLVLFDAENDLAIAVDERDRALRLAEQAERDIATAEAQLERAKERRSAARDAQTSRLLEEGAAVLALKIEYLERRADLMRQKVSVQNALLRVYVAKHELAKARLVKRYNLQGASTLDVPAFEAAVADETRATERLQKEVTEDQERLTVIQKRWLERRDRLTAQGAGGLGTPWADDATAWRDEPK
jgi:hypothetical protein